MNCRNVALSQCRIVAMSHCRNVAILCLFHEISYRKLLIISISDCNKNKR